MRDQAAGGKWFRLSKNGDPLGGVLTESIDMLAAVDAAPGR